MVVAGRRGRSDEDVPYTSIAGFRDPLREQQPRKGAARRAQAARLAGDDDPEPRPPRTRAQRIRRLVFALFVIFVCVPALLFFAVYWSSEIPEPGEVAVEQPATVLAADGTTVLAKIIPPQGNRIPIPLTEVPMHVREAVLAAEDRTFYTNAGYSTSGFLRAARDNLAGHDNAGGGSTITQQYVKNAFLSSERTVTRKMRELIIAAKMSRQWSKDEILAAYLNTIYYGRGAYGIAAAAKAYFGKPVPELTLAEGAVLAAVIRSPSVLDPETHFDQLRARWQYVLDGMVEMRVLAPGDRDATVFPPILALDDVATEPEASGPEGHIRTMVLRELRAAGLTDADINTGALQITTTIDPVAQAGAVDSVRARSSWQPPELRAAVVSIDPRSGAVRAYYGGEDGTGFDFAQAPLQTGSAFKVFALVAAQMQGIPVTRAIDSSPITDRGTTIKNVDGDSCGRCSLAEALKRSLNTSFYRLTMTMADGPRSVAQAAHLAGIPEHIPGVEGETLTENGEPPLNGIVLGQYLVRPIDMASAYATLAASGVYRQPYFVQRVTTGNGQVLLDRGPPETRRGKQLPEPEQRISPAIADATTRAMEPIANYSNGHGLAGGRPSASKTGTTQLGETGANKDAWMVGYTPSLSTAVWVGTEHPQPLRDGRGNPIWGSGLPADIWKQTMDTALAGSPVEEFPTPPLGGSGSLVPAPPPSSGGGGGGGGGGFDILNPPSDTPRNPAPIIIIPPAPSPSTPGEWFPGLGGEAPR
ncbi:transglycosylase domain-containing protein [Nocardia coubleae]|uniref:Penicillin-binding protein n=1 Tax=Nocardia coubleae TaxID=356147 RepID=A0A846W3Q9_9NOCA|nr:transglycosylase domain-containing protein [Nocardia coubleae]NKX87386.1 penicillin-binding protein [Nocardia coubleae]